MRIHVSILCLLTACAAVFCLTTFCAVPAAAADKKLSQAEQAQAAKMAKVDAVAKQAFTAADHNHNDILSKTEFPDAESMLEEGFMQLGNQGVLGKLPPGNQAANAGQQAAGAGQGSEAKTMAATAGIYKKNRITLSEFQLFARTMSAQAEVMIAQNNAYQAQMQKQMQMHNSRGRRQVHTGTPIFLGP
jgi:hypothetical protein